MAEDSNIAWTRSTFNPFIGCTEISPGCDHCYARELAKRYGWAKWGAGEARKRTSAANWRKPLAWNKQAQKEFDEGIGWAGSVGPIAFNRPFWPVLCASLADVFDNEVPDEWRRDLWDLIELTPNLTWLLLTKRIGNVARLARTHDWCNRKNVWLGISVVNQQEADRDIPKLLNTPAHKRFVSYEPALGPIDWNNFLWKCCGNPTEGHPGGFMEPPDPPQCCNEPEFVGGIDWIIVGGESSQGKNKARPFDIRWARDTVNQCKAARVAVFVKQMGSLPYDGAQQSCEATECCVHDYTRLKLADRAGAAPMEWAEDLRVRQFPG